MATTAVDLNRVAGQATQGTLNATGQINNYIDRLLDIQQSNNAVAADMAAEQRDWSAEQAELTRQFNAAEAAKNRDWQKMMSDTAHQREVSDLMAAGLNPVLSATGGNGASVTSGATASGSNPSGASASPDTSLNSAIVSLLGSSLTAMTRLADMSTSAMTQSAVADKYTAAQQLAALISADASKYGANMSSAASMYSADTHAGATRYAAQQSAAASRYAASQAAAASRYAADQHYALGKYQSDQQAYLTKNYPQTMFGTLNSILNGATSASGQSMYELLGEGIADLFGLNNEPQWKKNADEAMKNGKKNIGYSYNEGKSGRY